MGKERRIYLFEILIGLLFVLALNGCGRDGHSATANPPGVFIDTTTEDFLRKAFDQTKACADLLEGKFEEISIIVMPPSFPCKYYANGCSGEYVSPNSIKIGSLPMWKHEVLHYLLHINTGDPDTHHQNKLFQTCT